MDKFWNCALVAVACYITYSISFSNNALAGLCGTTYCETEGCYELFNQFHPGGICVPGKRRPYVLVDGTILPCERVPRASFKNRK